MTLPLLPGNIEQRGEESGGGHLVVGGDDEVIQSYRHGGISGWGWEVRLLQLVWIGVVAPDSRRPPPLGDGAWSNSVAASLGPQTTSPPTMTTSRGGALPRSPRDQSLGTSIAAHPPGVVEAGGM